MEILSNQWLYTTFQTLEEVSSLRSHSIYPPTPNTHSDMGVFCAPDLMPNYDGGIIHIFSNIFINIQHFEDHKQVFFLCRLTSKK